MLHIILYMKTYLYMFNFENLNIMFSPDIFKEYLYLS